MGQEAVVEKPPAVRPPDYSKVNGRNKQYEILKMAPCFKVKGCRKTVRSVRACPICMKKGKVILCYKVINTEGEGGATTFDCKHSPCSVCSSRFCFNCVQTSPTCPERRIDCLFSPKPPQDVRDML